MAIEQYFYNAFIENLERGDPPGYSFTSTVQKEVFSGKFVEDPILMTEYVYLILKQAEETTKTKTKKEQSELALSSLSRILEMITLRHRLLTAASSTEVLAKLYKRIAVSMGFEEYHMFLRYVQFDFAKYKENAGVPLTVFVNELNSEDSKIDRFTSNSLHLAVNEIEESQIGKFSFKGKENIQQLTKQSGIDNLQLVVKLQVLHNSALIAAVTQAHACFLSSNLLPISRQSSASSIDMNRR